MSNWYKIPSSWRMSEREHKMVVDGINIVIGATLGFVLVGAEGIPDFDFAALLTISVAVVVLILYLEASEHTLFFAVLTALAIMAFPSITQDFLNLAKVPKLQPTLAIWATMIFVAQLLPKQSKNKQSNRENNK